MRPTPDVPGPGSTTKKQEVTVSCVNLVGAIFMREMAGAQVEVGRDLRARRQIIRRTARRSVPTNSDFARRGPGLHSSGAYGSEKIFRRGRAPRPAAGANYSSTP